MQNQIEGAGVTTISMSVQPHITATVGAPRALYIRYPAGNQVGEAGKPIQQRAILTAALEAAYAINEPGTVLELPFRWRRFPIEEEPVFKGTSRGYRHPKAEAIGPALDNLVKVTREYQNYMEQRLAEARAEAKLREIKGLVDTLEQQLGRVNRLLNTLDTTVLDQCRETIARIATLELRADGKFV